MQRKGQIAAILVRRIGKRYELIAGERRVRAIRDHTDIKTIQARIVVADDVEARRLSAAENALREDLTVFEAIEDTVTSSIRNSSMTRSMFGATLCELQSSPFGLRRDRSAPQVNG